MQDHGLSKALSNDHNKENEMASDIGNNNGKTHDNDLTAKPPTFSEPMLVTNLVKNRKKSKLLKDHDMLTSSVKTDTIPPSLVTAEEVVTDDVSTEVVMVHCVLKPPIRVVEIIGLACVLFLDPG